MKSNEKKCLGKCPKCNSDNINWFESDLQDGFVVYTAKCNDCKTNFCENYKLEYEVSTFTIEE